MARNSGRQQQRSGKKQRSQRQQQQRRSKRQQQRSQKQQQRSQRQQQTSKRRSQKKRPLNAFMKQLIKAKSNNSPSFEYNGNSYKRKELKTGMVVYKSA